MGATLHVSEQLKLHNKRIDEYQLSIAGRINSFEGVIA